VENAPNNLKSSGFDNIGPGLLLTLGSDVEDAFVHAVSGNWSGHSLDC
jgi:hypothetical protein